MTLYNANTVNVGDAIKSSDLASLAKAFNSRILEAAGDSHWRIPYYIYNAYFAKPRLDNSNQYTPESEFFDFYQFVNPSTDAIWPVAQPQTPEGANLQTNPLNRFIFGMDFKEKDASGNWIFERENVKVGNAREKLNTDISGDVSSFRGKIFPFFLTVGSSSPEYTAWGLASNAFSNAYVNGNTQNPTGHSFGGYYGLSSFITDPKGCGSDSVRDYPESKATLFPIDGTQTIEKYVCDEGAALSSYNTLTSESSTYPGSFKYSVNDIPQEYFAKNRYHKGQNLSTVYFGREQKNHIRRLIYNYITYAKGFDFDFFFSSQYAYAPELGQFQSLTAYYDGDNNLVSIKDVNISSLRPSFTDITLNTNDSKFISIDNTSITSKDSIASSASIYKKRLGTSDDLGSITGADSVYKFLWETGLTSTPYRISDIFIKKSGSATELYIPGSQDYANGIFTFHHYAVLTSTLKSFTLNVYVKDDQDNIIYEQSDGFDYSNLSEKNTRLIRSFITNKNYNISFEISNVTLKEGVAEGEGSINIEPVFLLTYKPGIHDAYALIRTCTYLNHDDEPGEANFDSENHPLTGINEINGALGEKITNDLKKYGLVTSQSVSNIETVSYDTTEASINTNPVFEAARRLSLFTRILGGNNFIDIEPDGETLKFKRYARQGYNSRLQQTNKDVLTGTEFSGLRFFDKYETILPGSGRDVLTVDDFDTTGYLSSLDKFLGDYNESFSYRRNYIAAKKYIVTRNEQNLIINGVEVGSAKPLGFNDPKITKYVESFKIYSTYDTLLLKRDNSRSLQEFKFFQFEDIRGAKSTKDINVFYSENSSNIEYGILTQTIQDYEEDGGSILLGEISNLNDVWEIYIFQRDGVNSVLQSFNVPTNSPGLYTVTNTGEFLTEPNVVSNINALYSANYSNLAARYNSPAANNIYSLSSFEGQLPHLLSDSNSNILSGETLTGLKYIEIELALNVHLKNLYNLFYPSDTPKESISLDEYNTELAGFNLALSYFPDAYTLNDFTNDLKNPNNITIADRTNETDEKAKSPFLKVYDGMTEVSSSLLSFHNYFVLPSLEAGQTLKLSVPVNLYTDNTGKYYQLGNIIYLLGKPFIYSESNPAAIAIVKSGSLLIQNIVQEYQENPELPQQRDIFQGIVGEDDNENGIIEIAPAGGFTNEWVLWMNFLPYSGAETSVYKESVYGATASPFIDRCHVRSGVLRKSLENSYFNLGQTLSYTPVAPPSYRYAPLFVKGKINFENVVSSEDAGARLFYKSCAAFKKPYKVKKAYYKTGVPDVVYIELDRKIEGFPNLADPPASQFGYRTDANGLVDWVNRGTGVGKQSFRLGDVSITHDTSRNAVLEAGTNGFKGSYYPRFFFLKLIPSPYLDENSTQDIFDSPAYHRELKQAELYLNAMREGFALTSGGRFMSGVPCFDLNGHLTPPDYSYEQLIFNATTIDNDHYGNVWPSLQTFSSKKNENPLRPDNPQGFGAIINNGTYAEHYNTIARAINKLTYFRVPMPLRYTATENTYYSTSIDNTPPTPSLVGSNTLDLRNQNGEVLSVGSSTRRGYNLDTDEYYWEAKQIVLNVSRNTTLINNAYTNISSMIGTDNIVAYDFSNSYLINKLIASSDINDLNQIEGCGDSGGSQLAVDVDNSSPACFLGSSFTLQPPPSTNIELIIDHGGDNCNTSENLSHVISVYENSFIIVSPTVI